MKTLIIKRSAAAVVVRLVLLLFCIDTVYALLIAAFLSLNLPTPYYLSFIVWLWVIHTIKYLLMSALLLYILLSWLGVSYLVGGQQLIIQSGIYAMNEKVYELKQLKEIKVHQDWLGRLFHYGTLTLELAASGFHDNVELKEIHQPRQYEQILATRLN